MFCQKCGKEINENAVICVNCGCEVSNNIKDNRKKSQYGLILVLEFVAMFFSISGCAMFSAREIAEEWFLSKFFLFFAICALICSLCSLICIVISMVNKIYIVHILELLFSILSFLFAVGVLIGIWAYWKIFIAVIIFGTLMLVPQGIVFYLLCFKSDTK